MNNKLKFSIILVVLLLFNIAIVSASDVNSTNTDLVSDKDTSVLSQNDNELISDAVKDEPIIAINKTSIKAGDSIGITLKNSNNDPIANLNLTANINNQNYIIKTDANGAGVLKVLLKPNKYVLKVSFLGNGNYTSVNETFNVDVSKGDSNLIPISTSVIKGDYFQVYLKDGNGNPIVGGKVSFFIFDKTYTDTTDNSGVAKLKIGLNRGNYDLKVSFGGNDYYKSVSKNINLLVPIATTIEIGNARVLTNGYLRFYLKSDVLSAVSNKAVKIIINGKSYAKKTNSEGIIVFKPNAAAGTMTVTVSFAGVSGIAGCSANKTLSVIKGNVKDPFTSKIPLRNGVPDVDLMPANYVMANNDWTYTLTKAQYKQVLKRDTYSLYLTNKLPKYTFFKSKAQPKLYHIIKREKWNVIERALNTKIVLKNKYNYWPSQISASLKGKSYNYPEVRDIQNTGYTCGPTSASMCSQVLRNYVNEKQLAKLAGSTSYSGSSTSGLKRALEKNHFKCTYYYKSSYNKAINALKKGGCALIFHTWGHYVSILDISADGKKVLVGNPSGDYDTGSHDIPTNWLTVGYMKSMFNNYDTSGLIVKLKYSLSKATIKKIKYFYLSMGANWDRHNTDERIPDIGY